MVSFCSGWLVVGAVVTGLFELRECEYGHQHVRQICVIRVLE